MNLQSSDNNNNNEDSSEEIKESYHKRNKSMIEPVKTHQGGLGPLKIDIRAANSINGSFMGE